MNNFYSESYFRFKNKTKSNKVLFLIKSNKVLFLIGKDRIRYIEPHKFIKTHVAKIQNTHHGHSCFVMKRNI